MAGEDPYLADLLASDKHAALAAASALEAALLANVVELVRLAVAEYLVSRRKDGACAGCYLGRLSLALEGHGWELGQALNGVTHREGCTYE